jgi:CheY-like chemotaxis protein
MPLHIRAGLGELQAMEEQSKRVLVVDDDADLRRLLVSMLRRRGLHVDEAADGEQALALAGANRYGVMLLDLLMPVLDGYAVLEQIERDATAPRPVVLVITGADRAAVERIGAHRVHGVMRKPFDVEEIVNVVVACAEIRERSSFETMALATMIAGGPFLALLQRLP